MINIAVHGRKVTRFLMVAPLPSPKHKKEKGSGEIYWDLLIQWNMLEWPRGRNCTA